MKEGLLEVWRTHQEINLFVIDRIPSEGFAAVPLLKSGKPSRGRSVSKVFAHMHAVRVAHLKRDLLQGVPRFETDATPGRAELSAALESSGRAVERRLSQIVETGERIKARSGLALLGYLIAHESHHRGQIALALKQSGVRVPEEMRFGPWAHWFRPAFELE